MCPWGGQPPSDVPPATCVGRQASYRCCRCGSGDRWLQRGSERQRRVDSRVHVGCPAPAGTVHHAARRRRGPRGWASDVSGAAWRVKLGVAVAMVAVVGRRAATVSCHFEQGPGPGLAAGGRLLEQRGWGLSGHAARRWGSGAPPRVTPALVVRVDLPWEEQGPEITLKMINTVK